MRCKKKKKLFLLTRHDVVISMKIKNLIIIFILYMSFKNVKL